MKKRALTVLVGLMTAAPQPVRATERLLVPQLSGWVVVDTRQGDGIEANSLIPGGETEATWTRRLTVQAYRGTPMGAREFLEGLIDRIDEVCDGIAVEPLILTPGPYEAARRIISCGRYRGDQMGSVTFYDVIRGREALYMLARSWRGDPFIPSAVRPVSQAELARWAATFDAVRLCDTEDPARPCPSP